MTESSFASGDAPAARTSPTRALVLGGGGVTGIGWEVGLLAGLLDTGIDLRSADTVIGTSAGSFVGTNFASGADWDAVFADQARTADYEPVLRTDPALYQAWTEAFRSGAGDPEAVGAGFGRVAREFGAPVDLAMRHSVVRARLRPTQWPATMRVAVTDADTGRLELLGPSSSHPMTPAAPPSGRTLTTRPGPNRPPTPAANRVTTLRPPSQPSGHSDPARLWQHLRASCCYRRARCANRNRRCCRYSRVSSCPGRILPSD